MDEEAKNLLINYPWPGNVRELKNIAEQISVLSQDKNITAKDLTKFLQTVFQQSFTGVDHTRMAATQDFANEREMLYKLFFDMKKDVTELKRMFLEVLQNPGMVTKDPCVDQ